MQEILDNSQFFTHGGRLSALYGMLSSNKLSSNAALARAGDDVYKFTDPNNQFKQEDGYIFFESVADRGKINYAGLVDNQPEQFGYSFLLVASSESLLNQVDMLGNSDGILMGRSDGKPLEIDINQLDCKILIPESYKETIENYCDKLKALGITPPEDILLFKPLQEIKELLSYKENVNSTELQKKFCEDIGLEAKISDKNFNVLEKSIETKTSQIQVSCSLPLVVLTEEENKTYDFNNAHDLLNHMKKRPTPANLQRNTMILFGENSSSPLKEKIGNISNGKPLILDLTEKPEDITFCLNTLANVHPSKNEGRISRAAISKLQRKFENISNSSEVKNLIDSLEIIQERDITKEEYINISEKNKIDNLPPPIIMPPPLPDIVSNIKEMRKNISSNFHAPTNKI